MKLKQRQQLFLEDVFSTDPLKGSYGSALARPEPVFEVYRNTVIGNLVNALRITYPKVLTVIGEGYFNDIASFFCRHHIPKQGVLDIWGDEFPPYLEVHPISRTFPFLSELAHFEWRKSQIFLLPEQSTLELGFLKELSSRGWEDWRATVTATAFLFQSTYDFKYILDAIDQQISLVHLPQDFKKKTYLLGVRQEDCIQTYWLDQNMFHFLRFLQQGGSVLEAYQHIPTLDLPQALVFLFSHKLFTHIQEA